MRAYMRKFVLLTVALLALGPVRGQGEAFLTIECQENVKLPWGLYNLSVVDGRLYGCSAGMMMTDVQSGDYVWAMEPDTLLKRMHEGLQYVVRNPRDGRLYFCVAAEGGSQLFVRVKDKGWLVRKNRRVTPRGWTDDINHPTFSADGNYMVFSSRGKGSLGGYDLWCSHWNGRIWETPVNMGVRVNTAGNEIHPTFYYDYLLFASDGLNDGRGYSICATHVRPNASSDMIIFDNYIVQRLPEPINSSVDDWEMVVDTAARCGYWISTRNGHEELFRFKGRLDGMMLQGTVTDHNGTPLGGANVVVTHEGRKIGSAQTRADGTYGLFVQPNVEGRLSIEKPDYFKKSYVFSSARVDDNALIAEMRYDVRLEALPLGTPLTYDSIFGTNAGTDLEPRRMEALTSVISFLRDNPEVEAHFTLECDQTTDQTFNILLTEQRISSLRTYVSSQLPTGTPIFFHNGTETGENTPSASRQNRLTVLLRHAE